MTEAQIFLDTLRRRLGREPGAAVPPRPPVLAPRMPGDPGEEMARLLAEIEALAGKTRRLDGAALGAAFDAAFDAALADLVQAEQVRAACVGQTPLLRALGIEDRLRALGVAVVSPLAGKHALAACDLGVTGADFALPETGTLGLLSSPEQPRLVSLLPRVHLALITPAILQPDLHPVLAEARRHNYLILITGPSRTSDIELTLTLGVHGPKALYVWALPEETRRLPTQP